MEPEYGKYDDEYTDDEFEWRDLALGPSRIFKIAFWLIILAFLAVLAVLWFFMATARAEGQPTPPCGPFIEISKTLLDKAHEVQISGGFVDEQSVFIVFATPKGETWTGVIVNANTGIACVQGMGTNWFQLPVLLGDPV